MIKTIVFDIGGVLAYDVWEHLLLDPNDGVAARCHLDFGEVEAYGLELWEKFAYRSAASESDRTTLEKEYWQRFIRRFRLVQTEDFFIGMTDRFIRPVDGMLPLLDKLRSKGLNLAICSNNNEFWIRRQMDKVGLHRYFEPERVISSARIGVPKISRNFEMFKAVSGIIGGDDSTYLFIEDRFENIARAMEYGWAGILFPRASPNGARYLDLLLMRMGI